MIDKEEYKKVNDTLMCSDRKQSEVHWWFANKNRTMGCSDEVLCQHRKSDMNIVDVLKELQNVYKILDAFRCSVNVSKYVSSVLPEFKIKNPVAYFDEMVKAGAYDNFSPEELEPKRNDTAAMSFHPDVKNESKYVCIDVRDAYSDAMKAASDLQSALKKIHDSALFVSILYPFYTEQYFELDECGKEQVDKIKDEEFTEPRIDDGKIYACNMLSREDLISSVFGIQHIFDGDIIASYLDCKDAFKEDDYFDVKKDGLYTPDGKTRYIREYNDGSCRVNDAFYRFLVSFNSDWTFAKGRFSLAMNKRLNS